MAATLRDDNVIKGRYFDYYNNYDALTKYNFGFYFLPHSFLNEGFVQGVRIKLKDGSKKVFVNPTATISPHENDEDNYKDSYQLTEF